MPPQIACPFAPTAQPLRSQRCRAAPNAPTRQPGSPHRRGPVPPGASRGGGGDDMEVAVFRFTLGIPGFDDALIPRVVGLISAAALLANHLASPQPVSAPQSRVEALGAALAAVAVAAPSLQARLEELRPGRGRAAAAESVPGGAALFALSESAPEAARRDLAWASYALLKNANICGMAVFRGGRAVACRGILGASVAAGGGGEAALASAGEAWAGVAAGARPSGEPALFEDRGALARAGLDRCGLVPSGAGAVVVLPLRPLTGKSGEGPAQGGSGNNVLVLVSERERALSAKEVRWAQGVAALLAASLP